MSGRLGRRRIVATLGLAVALVAGCGSGSTSATPVGGASGAPGAGTASATRSSAPRSGAASPTAGGSASPAAGSFENPVIRQDFPDPFVLRDGATYYAYATTDGAQHLQLATSPDLVTWQLGSDPLPTLPSWSTGDTWAPEVAKTTAGYVLYYTAHDPDLKRPDGNGAQCITLARADHPEGPFVDSSSKPLVCQVDRGGSIDATSFVDADGSRYLIWKNDGNCCGLPTRFSIQRLTADGLHLTGSPKDLGVVNDATWEGHVIEAPTLLRHDGRYVLFYSANDYDSGAYAVGYATAKMVTGPYVDAKENPIVASQWGHHATSRARGPGHQSVVEAADGTLWMTFHAWDADAVGYERGGMREMWIDRLQFEDGRPVVDGPKDGPIPIP